MVKDRAATRTALSGTLHMAGSIARMAAGATPSRYMFCLCQLLVHSLPDQESEREREKGRRERGERGGKRGRERARELPAREREFIRNSFHELTLL
jgi:hypothetical protein